ncbi:hypothetical protein OEG84_14100 [Hoeflea sp. G2-23]|uniref:Uncharacterized protein n=1 Tax=Hoeflea algicola TaxID=2983763 RepID=A0ABT3ZAQ4_9HYPH|nr:hypothetical protein [Hoeflea algicola]MCY0148799.1 hypothetical protein [Hoeflea algicola]
MPPNLKMICQTSAGGSLVTRGSQTYGLPMKIFLYVVAAATFLGPIIGWAYIVGLACAFQPNSPGCSVRLQDYWDVDFLILAALPWIAGTVSLFLASRRQ